MENANATTGNSAPVQESTHINSGDNDGFAPSPTIEQEVSKEPTRARAEDEIAAKALKNEKPEEKKEEKPLPKKYKVKVDGRDEEVDEEELLRSYSKAQGAEKKFAEAAKMRKQAEEFIELLRKDPRKVLENPNIGLDLRKFAEEYLAEQLKIEMLSPEQKKLREYEEKLKSFEEEKKKQAEEQEKIKHQEEVKKWSQHYENTIQEALKVEGLPKTTTTVRMMAQRLQQVREFGIDISPNELAKFVKQDYQNAIKELFSVTEGDALINILGEEFANKIRKADLARLRKPATPVQEKVDVAKNVKPEAAPEKKYMNLHEWRAELEKKIK